MVMDDMNELGVWAPNSKYYEHLMIVVDMNEFDTWA